MMIEVKNTPKQRVDIKVANVNQKIDITQDVILVPVYKDIPEYEGVYDVTPKVVEQTLATKNKVLRDDVTIQSIPFFNVSNTSGGTTAYIGNEV